MLPEHITWFFIITQLLGFFAFAVGIVSYQFKSQRTMFGFRVSADFIWSVHYLMLGALTPAITVFIAFVRTGLVVFVAPKLKTQIVIVAVLSVIAVCAVTFNGYWPNLLPGLTAIFYGLSTYYHEDYLKSRAFMAIGCAFWIVIGVVFQSYAEIISSGIGMVSILVGYGRHRRQGLHVKP